MWEGDGPVSCPCVFVERGHGLRHTEPAALLTPQPFVPFLQRVHAALLCTQVLPPSRIHPHYFQTKSPHPTQFIFSSFYDMHVYTPGFLLAFCVPEGSWAGDAHDIILTCVRRKKVTRFSTSVKFQPFVRCCTRVPVSHMMFTKKQLFHKMLRFYTQEQCL